MSTNPPTRDAAREASAALTHRNVMLGRALLMLVLLVVNMSLIPSSPLVDRTLELAAAAGFGVALSGALYNHRRSQRLIAENPRPSDVPTHGIFGTGSFSAIEYVIMAVLLACVIGVGLWYGAIQSPDL